MDDGLGAPAAAAEASRGASRNAPRSMPRDEEPIDLALGSRIGREPAVPELLRPLLDEAEAALAQVLRGCDIRIGDAARRDLLEWFEQTLARLTNDLFLQRYSAFHLVRNPLWRPRRTPPGDAPAGARRDMLDAYIAWERAENALADAGEYPELARLVRVARANWLAASRELLERIERHRPALADLAGCPTDALGALTGARFGISDPHEGGRTAAILSFGERRVVYKPRTLSPETSWTGIANGVLEGGLDLDGYPLRAVEAGRYGFMEFVAPAPCAGREAVARCYRRYGGLLAVAHALGTCDLHHENVIVTGEHPVVIDAEPLFRARLAVSEAGQDRLGFERNLSLDGLEFRESVLELGLLPMVMRSPLPVDEDGRYEEFEMGGLAAYARSPVPAPLPCGRGSDDLQGRLVPLRAAEFPNLPTLDGEPQWPQAFVGEIVDGFDAAHRFMRRHRDRYVGPGGELTRFAGTPVRVLARATMDYSAVLTRSLSPERLRSSEERARFVAADLAYLSAPRFDSVRDLAGAEAARILDGDIPRFEVRADEAACESALLRPPVEGARDRWAALDDFDRALQLTSIRERLLDRKPPSRSADLAPQVLLSEAAEAVAGIVAAALSPETDPAWAYATYAPGLGATLAHADRESLYDGAAGTALVVAEAGRALGEAGWRRLAARVLEPLVRGAAPLSVRRSGGMARGLGGLVYAMVRVGEAAGEESLIDAAVRLSVEHGQRLAREDGLDEVLYGRAGLLLAMLALHRRRPRPDVLAVADLAAKELLGRARRAEAGLCWPLGAGRAMPNVSHGAAGIAMALARWAKLRGDAAAAEAAREALRFDDSFFVGDEHGWRDARMEKPAGEPLANWSWCNGRSGGLVARLAVADALGAPFHDGPAAGALEAAPADVLTEVQPGLCCGTPGLIDSMLCLHARTALPGPRALAEDAVRLVCRHTPLSQRSTLTPSLFSGSAAHAFALLRAARPQEIAPVVWFE